MRRDELRVRGRPLLLQREVARFTLVSVAVIRSCDLRRRVCRSSTIACRRSTSASSFALPPAKNPAGRNAAFVADLCVFWWRTAGAPPASSAAREPGIDGRVKDRFAPPGLLIAVADKGRERAGACRARTVSCFPPCAAADATADAAVAGCACALISGDVLTHCASEFRGRLGGFAGRIDICIRFSN